MLKAAPSLLVSSGAVTFLRPGSCPRVMSCLAPGGSPAGGEEGERAGGVSGSWTEKLEVSSEPVASVWGGGDLEKPGAEGGRSLSLRKEAKRET